MELAIAINQLQPRVNLTPEAGEAVKPVCLNVSESFLFSVLKFYASFKPSDHHERHSPMFTTQWVLHTFTEIFFSLGCN